MLSWSSRAITLREIGIGFEDRFDGAPEQPRDAKGEGQAWIEPARLDRDHRLSRHAERLGELRLGPHTLGAEQLDSVLHEVL